MLIQLYKKYLKFFRVCVLHSENTFRVHEMITTKLSQVFIFYFNLCPEAIILVIRTPFLYPVPMIDSFPWRLRTSSVDYWNLLEWMIKAGREDTRTGVKMSLKGFAVRRPVLEYGPCRFLGMCNGDSIPTWPYRAVVKSEWNVLGEVLCKL